MILKLTVQVALMKGNVQGHLAKVNLNACTRLSVSAMRICVIVLLIAQAKMMNSFVLFHCPCALSNASVSCMLFTAKHLIMLLFMNSIKKSMSEHRSKFSYFGYFFHEIFLFMLLN